jgi:hypothetical protein
MARVSRRANSAKQQGQRLRMIMRQKRILNAKAKGEPLIPDAVLQKLAALNLPPNVNVFVVQACLEKLLRG